MNEHLILQGLFTQLTYIICEDALEQDQLALFLFRPKSKLYLIKSRGNICSM